MAQRIVNIGTSANKGNGDPLRTAFDKINKNFTEVYEDIEQLQDGTIELQGTVVGDLRGSVFADDSTAIIDGATGTVRANALTGNLPALNAANLTNITGSNITGTISNADVNASRLIGALPAIDGSALTNISLNNVGDLNGDVTGDLTGSVFATDNTIMVNGTSKEIFGTLNGNVTGDVTGDVVGDLTGDVTGDVTGNITPAGTSTFTGTVDFDGANVTGLGSIEVTPTGDLTGSVFADDSTLLVDGVNAQIPSANLNGALPAIAGDAITIDSVAIKRKINILASAMAVGLS